MSLPGYGDPETWPAYSGHPNDPRAPLDYAYCEECGEETSDIDLYIETNMCEYCFHDMLDKEEEQEMLDAEQEWGTI